MHPGREPCGAPVTGEHCPSVPATSQASHWPVHAWSQHRPSTQKDEAQSFGPEQDSPFPRCGVQRPTRQKVPSGHSPSVEHSLPQPAPTQAPPQSTSTSGGQAPVPSQLAATVAFPAAHPPDRHWVPGPA